VFSPPLHARQVVGDPSQTYQGKLPDGGQLHGKNFAQSLCTNFVWQLCKTVCKTKGAGLSELWLPATRSGESEKGSENIFQSKNSSEHIFNLISIWLPKRSFSFANVAHLDFLDFLDFLDSFPGLPNCDAQCDTVWHILHTFSSAKGFLDLLGKTLLDTFSYSLDPMHLEPGPFAAVQAPLVVALDYGGQQPPQWFVAHQWRILHCTKQEQLCGVVPLKLLENVCKLDAVIKWGWAFEWQLDFLRSCTGPLFLASTTLRHAACSSRNSSTGARLRIAAPNKLLHSCGIRG